jgi:hypothetical protein
VVVPVVYTLFDALANNPLVKWLESKVFAKRREEASEGERSPAA